MLSAQQGQDALIGLSREVQQTGITLAVLKGPRGSGKSTIIKALLTRLASQSVQLVTASRWETAQPGAALGPLLQRSHAGSAGALGEALLEYLRREAPQPRVLVLENAQWVDDLSFQALHYTWRRLRNEPVLIVLVMRDQNLARLSPETREFLADSQLKILQLQVPDPTHAREIICARTGIDLPPMAVEQLVDYTEGNLQVVIELAQENPEHSWEQFDRWPPAPHALSRLPLTPCRCTSSSYWRGWNRGRGRCWKRLRCSARRPGSTISPSWWARMIRCCRSSRFSTPRWRKPTAIAGRCGSGSRTH